MVYYASKATFKILGPFGLCDVEFGKSGTPPEPSWTCQTCQRKVQYLGKLRLPHYPHETVHKRRDNQCIFLVSSRRTSIEVYHIRKWIPRYFSGFKEDIGLSPGKRVIFAVSFCFKQKKHLDTHMSHTPLPYVLADRDVDMTETWCYCQTSVRGCRCALYMRLVQKRIDSFLTPRDC